MKAQIENLIGKWRDVLIDREEALDSWSGSSAVAVGFNNCTEYGKSAELCAKSEKEEEK